jgi:integrase/recombinase XerD
VLRPNTGKPIDRRDAYRMVARIAKATGIPRHISPTRFATPPSRTPSTPASRSATPRSWPGTPTPRTTEHYDRARGNLDRHGVHFLTAYVAGV